MLSADEVHQLNRLTFGTTRASSATNASGTRVAKARGFGSEFLDFRQYQPGDDPRAIEWTIYSRLGQLVTRTYRTNAQLRVHLLVDVSASMTNGSPTKLACAAKLAALVGYAAIRAREAVGLATFSDTITQRLALSNSRSQLFRLFATLGAASAIGRSNIANALMTYGALEQGPGLAVVISDFFDEQALHGLRFLQHRGLTPVIVQVLSVDDIEPSLEGHVELVDVEGADGDPLFVDRESVLAYQAVLEEQRASLRAYCESQSLPFIHVTSSESFDGMLRSCSRAGLLVGQH